MTDKPYKIEAHPIKVASKSDKSKQIGEEDLFAGRYNGETTYPILEPPTGLNPEKLVKVPMASTILPQCIDFMVNGVTGFGWIVEPTIDATKRGILDNEIRDEVDRLTFTLENMHPGFSFSELLAMAERDLMTTGNAYWEMTRNKGGRHSGITPMLPQYMRICPADENCTEVAFRVRNGISLEDKRFIYKFRRYVQKKEEQEVFFREWGCPDTPVTKTQVVHISRYNPYTYPYGYPPWAGQMANLVGLQSAADVNQGYLRSGSMPSLIIMISGGESATTLTKEIKSYLRDLRDKDSADTFCSALVLHARGQNQSGVLPEDRPAPPKLEVKPLTPFIESDALFTKYAEATRDEVRSSFRISKSFLGLESPSSKASAYVEASLVSTWVLGPERKLLERVVNRILVREHGARYTEFKTKGPDITDYDELSQALHRLSGAVTPNDLRTGIVSKILGRQLEPWPEKWANQPLILIANAAGLSALGMTANNDELIDQKVAEKVEKCQSQEELQAILQEEWRRLM